MADDIGTRTDLLYTSTKKKSVASDEVLMENVYGNDMLLVCPYRGQPFTRYLDEFVQRTRGLIPVARQHRLYADHLTEVLGVRPTIALASIFDIMLLEPRELFITGLTFYKATSGNAGGYYAAYQNKRDYPGKATEKETMALIKRIGVHDPNRELAYFRELYSKHSDVIQLDDALQELVDDG
jgi:hypothetical protein